MWRDKHGQEIRPGDCFANSLNSYYQLLSLEGAPWEDTWGDHCIEGTVDKRNEDYTGDYVFLCNPERSMLTKTTRIECPTCPHLLPCTLNGVAKALEHRS